MYNNYNYPGYMYNNTQPQQQLPIQQGLKGRPVSSLEEAKVANIDFDGSLFVFPDIVNQKIYTKQVNLDGTASFNVYVLTQEPIEQKNSDNYVTKEELEKCIADLKEMIKSSSKATTTPINF